MITTMNATTEFDFSTNDKFTAAPTISTEEKTELARMTMNRISGSVRNRNS